jgi:hypothetical protein
MTLSLYLIGCAAGFLIVGIPLLLRQADKDFGDNRAQYATAITGGLFVVAACSVFWPLLLPIGLIWRAAAWYWDRQHRPVEQPAGSAKKEHQ